MTDEMKPIGLRDINFIRYQLSTTNQGYIHSVYDKPSKDNNSKAIIVKQTVKKLAMRGISHQNTRVYEDIAEETRILRKISNLHDVDPSICCIENDSVWEDEENYYYAMELCQYDLFEFTSKSFNDGIMASFIKKRDSSNKLACFQWIHKIQTIFQKLVRGVAYLHAHNIAHRDLSLENAMIFDEDSNDVKIIDFGVAYDTSQHNNSWTSTQRVGKSNYMAPEVFHKYYDRKYDARAADIWCLGIMLFMMLSNATPINRHNVQQSTKVVQYLIKGQIKTVIKCWQKEYCFTDQILDLLDKIFKLEKDRITMDQLLAHPFVGLNENTMNA